jgi:protein TonB
MDVRAYLGQHPLIDELGPPARRFARRRYQRRFATAVVLAGSLHFGAMITGIGIRSLLTEGGNEGPPPTVITFTSFRAPPSLVSKEPPRLQVTPRPPVPKLPPVGIPIPVPAEEAIVTTIVSEEYKLVEGADRVSGFGDEGNPGVPWGELDGSGIPDDYAVPPDPAHDRFQLLEAQPVVVENPAPAYPELARLARIEGMVIVRVKVGTNGKVEDAIVVAGAHDLLDQAALAAARRWVFIPGRQQKRPVASWVSIPFRFSLR